jgi:hypothetical protein
MTMCRPDTFRSVLSTFEVLVIGLSVLLRDGKYAMIIRLQPGHLVDIKLVTDRRVKYDGIG